MSIKVFYIYVKGCTIIGYIQIYQANTYDLSRRRLSVIDNFNADIIDQDTIPSDIIYYQG